MANPAPTINQINAFNATQGTTIDFNIIGGTELVRSNKIYIYDLSDNSLICTHLYVSTESIHELPANTDSSIVYESGKSSANFVNGAQYYAQIQTFTDAAGTQGGSGLSVAKMFWCLVDPTLTITTIPSTISTTSYNVSATYDANTSVVSNIIQQYQFSLYSATGSLLQSSGVVVGNGTQQGTSTAYDISYNFTGLSVGSSYYVVVDVTTTQGMSVSAQSGTFTVSIDTPTLGEATVVNNACDGYISVTSNLSSEYGGSGSGEIVSFETDSENVFTKLQVDLDPIQDLHGYDKPWVGGAGKNLYDSSFFTTRTQSGVTITNNGDGSFTLNGTASQDVFFDIFNNSSVSELPSNTYRLTGCPSGGGYNSFYMYTRPSYGNDMGSGVTFTNSVIGGSLLIKSGYTCNNLVFRPMLRVASNGDDTFAPYENICPISGHTDVVVSRASGQLIDTSTNQSGVIDVSGNEVANPAFNRTDFIPIDKAMVYVRTSVSSGYAIRVHGYSSSKAWMQQLELIATSGTELLVDVTVPDGVAYVRLSYPIVGVNNTELWQGTTYTTDLPQTVYGGTVDLVTGVLTVDKVSINPTSVYNVYYHSASGLYYVLVRNNLDAKSDNSGFLASNMFVNNNGVAIGNCYIAANETYLIAILADQTITTKAQANNWFANNNVQFVYELATPTTYQLTPQVIATLRGQNNVWSEQGNIELAYHIPITNLLVKRQDVDDVSGNWLTLYSQPITQASDMDFTFIDFLNQYGKTYKYALVPLLTQTQSGVEVEVEGGYTVSDEVQSIFDGVFISDSTGSQKCKANVGYGNVDMNQTVGTITPIGAKYPVVITNSQNQYHNGSISGTIVPDDYYYNGNLSRIDMVNKRNELEQFLTNKRAKIIKDWNGNIWLAMIMDNVSCTFNNNYGMGIVNFSTNWIEVGDPTNQQDLQATGLIDVGGA